MTETKSGTIETKPTPSAKAPVSMTQPTLKVAKIHPDAKVPTKGRETDAGYDLYCVGQFLFKPGQQFLVPCGVAIQLPPGHWAEIKDRSGRAKDGWRVGGGVVDEEYRGEWMVVMQNTSANEMMLNTGDKIAQFIVQRYLSVPVEVVTELDPSDRGAKGFGSSGN